MKLIHQDWVNLSRHWHWPDRVHLSESHKDLYTCMVRWDDTVPKSVSGHVTYASKQFRGRKTFSSAFRHRLWEDDSSVVFRAGGISFTQGSVRHRWKEMVRMFGSRSDTVGIQVFVRDANGMFL